MGFIFQRLYPAVILSCLVLAGLWLIAGVEVEFVWQSDDSVPFAAICPVCADAGPHRPVLVIPKGGPGQTDWMIVQCPSCASRFSTDRQGADYTPEAHPDSLHMEFYLEQNAGIRPMLEPLGWLEAEPGRRLLEIGGGFSFVSDFVQVELGWTAKGYDPSGLAALGRKYLGLDIVLDYWTDETPLDEPYDVAYASEVIEHIPEPLGFLASTRRAVGQNGVAILTTPNGAALKPDTMPAILAAIATPGLHLTLFSAEGLARALRSVGFQHVRVEERGDTLHAFASARDLPAPRPLDDQRYRSYLIRRAATPGLAPVLLSGLRYRLFKELVNGGESAAALEQFNLIAADILARFGLDISRPAALRPPKMYESEQEWLRHYPAHLSGLLYYRAVLANNAEGDPVSAVLYTAASLLVGASFRHAMQNAGIGDGETEVLNGRAILLNLIALVCAGGDSVPLLAAVEQASPAGGLLLSSQIRRSLRRSLRRNLLEMRHPDMLWRTGGQATVGDEVSLFSALLCQDFRVAPVKEWERLSSASDAAAVLECFRAIWCAPGADQAPASIHHARKLTLIRLVQLGAFEEADALFEAWGQPDLAHDSSVATALGIIAQARAGSR